MSWEPNRLEEKRLEKLERLREAGIEPYPLRSGRTHTVGEATALFAKLEAATPAGETTPHETVTVTGRLVSFRDMAMGSPTHGDWVAWVGRFEDLLDGGRGAYRVRLQDNLGGSDCGYPGVEILPDGTFVLTTYGHWAPGAPPFILSVRVTIDELMSFTSEMPPATAR